MRVSSSEAEATDAAGTGRAAPWFHPSLPEPVLAINHPEDWRHRLMLREMLHPTSASDVLIREAIRPKFERLQEILRQFCPDGRRPRN